MKSYDEMAQSVLVRAEKERIVQKRRNRNIVLSVIAGVCCLTCAILVGMRLNAPEAQDPMLNNVTVSQDKIPSNDTLPQDEMPSDATVPSVDEIIGIEPPDLETGPIQYGTDGIALLTTFSDGSYVQMMENVRTPVYGQFRIRDVRGLTVEEIGKVRSEEKATAEAIFAKTKGTDHSFCQYSSNGAIITMLFAGRTGVMIEDFTLVEDVSITTTGVGDLVFSTAIYNNSNARLYEVTWLPSDETDQIIYEDPTVKPSQFRDTITFTITYKDGSVKTVIVDISFDDEGMAYIVQREIKAS